MLYADVELDADADLVVPLDVVERGMHVAHGAVRVDGQRFEPDQLAVFRPGAEVKIRALRRAGTPDAPGGRALGWPAPHLVELRILFQRADRSRQDRLARRAIGAKADSRRSRANLTSFRSPSSDPPTPAARR